MVEPKIRFKRDDGSSYPDWEEIKLCDIATRITRKNTNNETDRPLTIASIEGLVDQRSYFGKTIASKDMSGYYLLKKGEFAYNKSYSVGYDYGSIKRLDKYDLGALSTLYICFELKNNIDSDFYNCYFNGLSWYSQMAEICAEGARNHGLLNVSPNDFFHIKLSVPSSKEEQQKIANFLLTVDEVISASEEEVANFETQKKAVMQKIFSQQVRFKKPDGTDFPDWEMKNLGTVADIVSGGTPDTENQEYWDNGVYYWFTPSEVGNTKYVYKSKRMISSLGLAKSSAKLLPKGSLLLTSRATVGEISIAGVECCTNQGFQSLIVHDDVDAMFIFYNQPIIKNYAMKNAAGSTFIEISGKNLSKCPLMIPCIEEQHIIADFLSNFDEAIAAAKKELELWKELKKGLLQQMFV